MRRDDLQGTVNELWRRFWPGEILPPQASWSHHLRSTAGLYRYKYKEGGRMVVSTRLMDQDQDVEATILHELIHHWQRTHRDKHIRASPSHGAEFCAEMFRVNSLLGREAVTPTHAYRLPASQEVEARLRKLLSLASSPNEHEAALAAARAQELMSRYQISLDLAGQVSDLPPVDEWQVAFSPRADTWRRDLWSALAWTNACALFWRSSRPLGCRWYLIGRPTAISQAQLLGEYLSAVIIYEAKREKRERQGEGLFCGLSYLSSFRMGMATRIGERLRDDFSRRERSGIPASNGEPSISALVVVSHVERERRAVRDFKAREGYAFERTEGGRPGSYSGYSAGRTRGGEISLNRPIPGGSPPKLLK